METTSLTFHSFFSTPHNNPWKSWGAITSARVYCLWQTIREL